MPTILPTAPLLVMAVATAVIGFGAPAAAVAAGNAAGPVRAPAVTVTEDGFLPDVDLPELYLLDSGSRDADPPDSDSSDRRRLRVDLSGDDDSPPDDPETDDSQADRPLLHVDLSGDDDSPPDDPETDDSQATGPCCT